MTQATEDEIAVLARVYEKRYGFAPEAAREFARLEAGEAEAVRIGWGWGEPPVPDDDEQLF